jgi:hypothetical protein
MPMHAIAAIISRNISEIWIPNLDTKGRIISIIGAGIQRSRAHSAGKGS